MKKTVTLFTTWLFASAVILSTQVKAQSSCAWAKKVGGAYEDNGISIATDGMGNIYSLGYFFSTTLTFTGTPNVTLHNTYGGACIYLVKHDSCGNLRWAKQANGHDGGDVYGTSVAADTAGNVYVTGFYHTDTLFAGNVIALGNGSREVFVAKYNTSGIAQWIQHSSGNAQERGNAISLDVLGNVYVAGSFNSSAITFGANSLANGTNDGFTLDAFIAKFDNTGANLWVRGSVSNSSTSGSVSANGIGVDASGNVYVAGDFESNSIQFATTSLVNNGFRDIYLVKYNAIGVFQWLRSAGGSQDDGANGVAADAAGNTYITGRIGGASTVAFGTYSVTNAAQSAAVFIAKYDANGTAQWASSTKGDYYSYNEAYGISLDVGGNAYIIGAYSSDSLRFNGATIFNESIANGKPGGDYTYDVFVAKYKANGILSWARTAGGDSNDLGNGIATGLNNSLYITGNYKSPSISFAGITLINTTNYSDAFIANNISTLIIAPDICLVSADSVSGDYNVIYWDKTTYAYNGVANFILYRETSTGVYKKIGSQPYSRLSEFVDTARSIGPANGDPNIGSFKYTLQIMDTSGTYSLMSPYHKTAYFQNSTGTFNWNIYEVGSAGTTPVSNCYLMRDDNSTNIWHSIGAVSGTGTTLNDPNFSTFQNTASWRVDQDGFNCTPTLRLANGNNSTMAAHVKSHSNQTNNRTSGIEKITNSQQISVYPNPANTNFIVETTLTEKQQLQLVDVTGKIVFSQTITGKTTIDASLLNDGVYNITIIGNGSVANKKLVILK